MHLLIWLTIAWGSFYCSVEQHLAVAFATNSILELSPSWIKENGALSHGQAHGGASLYVLAASCFHLDFWKGLSSFWTQPSVGRADVSSWKPGPVCWSAWAESSWDTNNRILRVVWNASGEGRFLQTQEEFLEGSNCLDWSTWVRRGLVV